MAANLIKLPFPVDVEAQLKAIEKRKCELSLVEFIKAAWPHVEHRRQYKHNWHIDMIAEHLTAITDGEVLDDGTYYNRLLINVPPGAMKALDENTPILTLDGFKRHGDLHPGDYVYGPDGKPVMVQACTQDVLEDSYRITFDDGAEIIAGSGHEWVIEREFVDKSTNWKRERRPMTVSTTELQATAAIKGTYARPDRIRIAKPVYMPKRPLLIDPYILGAWLGDGGADSSARGQAFYRVTIPDLQVALRVRGVLKNKHVPEEYLLAPYEDRLALLQGLMDTDGCAAKNGQCSFTNKNKKIADSVCYLVASIGAKPFISERYTMLNGKRYGPHYKVEFRAPDGVRVFRLQRKQDRVGYPQQERTVYRYVASVEPVGKRVVKCIQVEGGVYLAGHSLVPTHNSLLVNVFWGAWEWGPKNLPHTRIICASHSMRLSMRDGLKMRRLVTSEWFQGHWGDRVKLTSDQNEKCLPTGAQIQMMDGSLRAIESVNPGDKVLSYDLVSNVLVEDEVVHRWSNGMKPIRRVTLSDGSVVTATHNHRFYGWNDWSYVGDMGVGDPLAVVECLPVRHEGLDLDEVFMVSLWLAEGAKANTSYMVTTTDEKILRRLQDIANKRSWSVKKYGDCSYTVTASRNQRLNTPREVLKRYLGDVETYGLRSRSLPQSTDMIRVPECIFSANDEAILEFIGTYIASDGCVINGKNCGLSINSASERMVRDLAILVKRFGVQCLIGSQEKTYHYKGEKRQGMTSWRLTIQSRAEIMKLRDMNVYAKQDNFVSLLERCAKPTRHSGTRSATIPAGPRWMTKAKAIESGLYDNNRLTGGLSWRRIVKIEDLEPTETWHMETRRTHLFFAEGVLSHNTKFENTFGGFRQACAITGMTGARGDRVVVDDPHSVDSAKSDAERQNTIETFEEAVPSRLDDPEKSAIVVIMQRLHEEDVSGVILDKDLGYDHVMIPMRYEAARNYPTKLGYIDPREEEGELYFPDRFPEHVVDRDEKIMGQYATAGQHQQIPVPRGGGIIKPAWWKLWEHAHYPPMEYVLMSVDTAYTEDQENDPSALTVWGVFASTPEGSVATRRVDRYGKPIEGSNAGSVLSTDDLGPVPNLMLMYAWSDKKEFHALVEHVAMVAKRMKVDKILIENKAAGHSVAQEIRRVYSRTEDFAVQMYDPKSIDKVGRLHAVEQIFAEGMVWAPDKEWAEMVIRQVSSFPKGKHDDLVDTTSSALGHLRQCGFLTRIPERLARVNAGKQFTGNKADTPLYDA